MPPGDTELRKLSHRHFYTGTVLYLLAVQGRKVLELLLSPMPMTAPIYSAMEQPSEWVYYYQTTWRRM